MTAYADAQLRMFHRNLEAAAATVLDEPRTTEPARARRIIALLVETLGGFAYGTAAGELVRAVATWFGAESAGRIRAMLPSTARHFAPDAELDLRLTPPPLSVELLGLLRARVNVTARDLAALHAATLAVLPAESSRMSDAMFSDLNRDSRFTDRLEIEVRNGWIHACAAIERRRPRALEISPHARNLWSLWSRLAGNPESEPLRGPEHLNHYIVRVG